MSATIKALFEDVKSADSEAASVSTEVATKQRELSEAQSRQRLAVMRQQETRTRLSDALKPDRPYRLDDQHIVRKINGRLKVEELQDPEKETAPDPSIHHEPPSWKLYAQGAWLGFRHTAVVVGVLAALVFGGITAVGYLNGRPDAGKPPAPAPDDKTLSELAKKFKAVIVANLDRDKTTAAEAEKLAANFENISSAISQANAGAGDPELKDPAKIEARIKVLNQASVDGPRWHGVFVGFAEIANSLDNDGKLSSSADYIPTFDATAQALRSFAKGR